MLTLNLTEKNFNRWRARHQKSCTTYTLDSLSLAVFGLGRRHIAKNGVGVDAKRLPKKHTLSTWKMPSVMHMIPSNAENCIYLKMISNYLLHLVPITVYTLSFTRLEITRLITISLLFFQCVYIFWILHVCPLTDNIIGFSCGRMVSPVVGL